MPGTLDAIETRPTSTPERTPVAEQTRIKPPQSAPTLFIAGISIGGHSVGFADSLRSSGWPKEADRLELFFALTDERDDAPLAKARYWRIFVQSPIEIRFDEAADKKTCTYYARWANEQGDVGPWSLPVSKTVVT